MKRLVTAVAITLVLAGLGVGAYFLFAGRKADPITYKTQPSEKRRIVSNVTASGTLSARVTVQVGRIAEINVDFNSQVKKGQLLARIDPQIFQAAVAQASANFLSAKAQLARSEVQAKDAERQYARVKTLQEQSLASRAELETSETTAAVARAQIDVSKASFEQAQAALNQAQVNLSFTKIYSPIDGVVISRAVDVGQTVAASLSAPVLFTIAEDLRKMQIDTHVAESDIGRLEPGMRAAFTVDAFPSRRFFGVISSIRNAPQTAQNVVTYDTMIDVDNADLKLRPGMTANVTVTYAEKDGVLSVPNAALRFRLPADVAIARSSERPKSSASAGSSEPAPAVAGSASAAPEGSARGPAPEGSARRRRGGGDRGPTADVTRKIYVLDAGQVRSVEIKAGLSDGTFTEVLEGDIKEGDQVITDTVAVGAKGSSAPPLGAPTSRRSPF
jgi:HlyD family secretion protein